MKEDILKKQQDEVNEIIYAAIEGIVKEHTWESALFSLQLNMLAMLGAIKEECKKEGNYELLDMFLDVLKKSSEATEFKVDISYEK